MLHVTPIPCGEVQQPAATLSCEPVFIIVLSNGQRKATKKFLFSLPLYGKKYVLSL